MLKEDPAYAPETAEDVRMNVALLGAALVNARLKEASRKSARAVCDMARLAERGHGAYYTYKGEDPTWEKIEQDLFESFYEAVTEYIEYIDPEDAAEAARGW